MVCENCSNANPNANIYCGQCGSGLKGKMITLTELVSAGNLNENDTITCKFQGGRNRQSYWNDLPPKVIQTFKLVFRQSSWESNLE